MTPEDLTTLSSLKYLTELDLNLDEDLKMVDAEGNPTTVLPSGQFKGSALEKVSLNGFTEIGASAFARSNDLETVVMSNVVTIGGSAFEETSVEVVTLPESIKSIGKNAFVGKRNGKREMHITIEATTPPTIDGSFAKHADADVTVPDGCLGNYISIDLGKPFKDSGDTKWGGLRVIDNAQKLITYHGVNSWDVMYAYVVDNTAITEGRFPTTFENGDKILSGWNTEKDGTGTSADANTVVTEDMTLYAQWSDPAVDLDVTVSYSNVNEAGEVTWTNQDVTVTLTANEPVQSIEGWTLDETQTVLTKAHDKNGTYHVTVRSADGQEKEVEYTVSGIDKKAPNIKIGGTGNGENYREIKSIAIHDPEGISYLMINETKTEINDKYKYFTDIKALGVVEGTNTAVVVDNAGNETKITFGYDKTAPMFKWIVDNNTQAQSKEVRLETSEEIQLPDEGWSLKGEENGVFVYVKTFYANWKDKNFTVTDLAGNVSEPQFVEVKRIDNSRPTVVELTQDITDWTNKDVTVTIKTSTDCVAPEGWKQVNKRTFTKVFNANGEYSVTLTSVTGVTGVTGDAHLFSITNIDKEAPVIDYAAIESANGYRKEIPVNEGEEYTEEKLVEMFTKPEWVSDNSGTATFKVDKWGLEHGLDGYQPFTSKTPGEYKVRFYAYDAAGNNSSFDVYVKVLEPEVEERTTTVNYTVFIDGRVRTGQWTHTGTETGEFRFDLSMVKNLPASYELEEGEEGYRMLQYGDTTAVTFYLTTK